ncbi:hypothetical protein BB561_000675 [Smittium simulii]|uniref:Telomere length regulation protein conserved domain-containing protein n=1 Tax=Smittium simulii TaxID=133385 RepID=A0A2T9YY43_9FUNG|nr:hypothetical protein BB561_000675 [Smittium simulii]
MNDFLDNLDVLINIFSWSTELQKKLLLQPSDSNTSLDSSSKHSKALLTKDDTIASNLFNLKLATHTTENDTEKPPVHTSIIKDLFYQLDSTSKGKQDNLLLLKSNNKKINSDIPPKPALNCTDASNSDFKLLNNIIIYTIQSPLFHLNILPKPSKPFDPAALSLIKRENPELYDNFNSCLQYWETPIDTKIINLSHSTLQARLASFSDKIITKIALNSLYSQLFVIDPDVFALLEKAIFPYLIFSENLFFNSEKERNLWKSLIFNNINIVLGYQKTINGFDDSFNSRFSSINNQSASLLPPFKFCDILYLTEQAMSFKVFSILVGISKLSIICHNSSHIINEKASVNAAVQEFAMFVRNLCNLPDKISRLVYYKLIPKFLTRMEFFQSIISDTFDSIEILIAAPNKTVENAIAEFIVKVCRIGYTDLLAKDLYQKADSIVNNYYKNNPDSQKIAAITKWISFAENLMLSYKERIQHIFFKLLFESISNKHIELLSNVENEQSNSKKIKTQKLETFYNGIYHLSNIIEIWAKQTVNKESFYKFILDLIKINASSSSKVYTILKVIDTAPKNSIFHNVNLTSIIASEWSSLNIVSKEQHIEQVFNDSKFMSAVPIYFDLTNTCVRLAATVVAEAITKKYSYFFGNIKPEGPDDIDLDFGLDSILLLGNEQERAGNLVGNIIGESLLIKQLRILPKMDLNINSNNISNTNDFEVIWYFDYAEKFNAFANKIEKRDSILHIESKQEEPILNEADTVYAKIPDSFLSESNEASTAEFVKPRPKVFLRDCVRALRSSSNNDWEIKYDVMKSLSRVLVTCDQKELVNLSEVVCRTVMQSTYTGPDSGLDKTSIRMSATWDQSRKNSLVCIGLRLPTMIVPFLIDLVLSKDFSLIDKTIILSSISAISLTLYGTLPFPKDFEVLTNNHNLIQLKSDTNNDTDHTNLIETEETSNYTSNVDKNLLKKMNILGLVENKKNEKSEAPGIIEIKEIKTTFRSKKLDLALEEKKVKNSIRHKIVRITGIDIKGYSSFIGPNIFFPLITTLLPKNAYSSTVSRDNCFKNIWEMNSSLILERMFTVIGIILHTAGNSPHMIKMISEYFNLVISLQSLPSINRALDKQHESNGMLFSVELNEPSNQFNRNQIISLLDTLLLGMVSIVDEESPLLSHKTLILHFRAELINIFVWLKEAPEMSSGFIAMVNLGKILSNNENQVYGSIFSGNITMTKQAYKHDKININIL